MRSGFIIAFFLAAVMAYAVPPSENDRFSRLDRNGDGKITREELPAGMRRNFSRVDLNGDGSISRSEDAAAARRRGPRPADKVPDSIVAIRDLAYAGTDHPRQRLDLYLPKAATGKLPVIVFIHGGGWRKGDKSGGRARVFPYVSSGRYAGVSIGYRLSGDAIWPAQIQDCKAAIRWLRANADKHGLDPDRIAVWGSSAGGHLAAMLGTSSGVKDMDGTLGAHGDLTSSVACVVDFFGPTDLLQMNKGAVAGAKMDHDAVDSPESKLLGGTLQENPLKAKSANPITYLDKQDPPFLLVHGTRDLLVTPEQSKLLHRAIGSAGGQSTLILVEGGGHGQGFGQDVTELVDRFFAHHLLGKTSTWKDQTLPASKSR
jgi:acetyl esterase/lipase